MADGLPKLVDSRHPYFFENCGDWHKWRTCYSGGDRFKDNYLVQFSNREDADDFRDRKFFTPTTVFAKSAVNKIRNSIFQRLGDVTRQGGSSDYHRAIAGEKQGVDRRGATMNFFLGNKVLTELLVMGRVGVYVDMPEIQQTSTIASAKDLAPYLYSYPVENILNYTCTKPEAPSEFQSILLKDSILRHDAISFMPVAYNDRYRYVWISQDTGLVNIQFYDSNGEPVDRDGNPGGPIELGLTRIPFVLMDIGDSLLKDICDHQIALLNLESSNVNYALKANFPFYTEQRDMRAVGGHLKKVNTDGTATTGGQGNTDEKVSVGVTQGRYYDKDTERPSFIAPPAEPLEATMKLQDKLESDINKIVNLAVTSMGGRVSAESKKMDNQGLEAGLSFIGLVLEGGERLIADYWSSYEEKVESKRKTATIKYPDRYSLKTDLDRIEEAEKLSELMYKVPSPLAKREIAKNIVNALFGGKVSVTQLEAIQKEIDTTPYTTSDPKTIIDAKDAGLVGEKTASMALGFNEDEYLTARKDHIRRATEIAKVQGIAKGGDDPGARGVSDLSSNPKAGKDEKEASRNTDLNTTTKKPVRGAGQETAEEE